MLKKTLESPLDCKEIQPVNPKGNQSLIFIGGLMLKLKLQYFGYLMQRTYWKRPWCWERLKAGGEGDNWGWDGWMASPTRWTWVWVGSRNCWWAEMPGVLQSMGLQRVRYEWATELNWISLLSSSIRGQTEEPRTKIPQPPKQKPHSQKANQNDHMDHNLV